MTMDGFIKISWLKFHDWSNLNYWLFRESVSWDFRKIVDLKDFWGWFFWSNLFSTNKFLQFSNLNSLNSLSHLRCISILKPYNLLQTSKHNTTLIYPVIESSHTKFKKTVLCKNNNSQQSSSHRFSITKNFLLHQVWRRRMFSFRQVQQIHHLVHILKNMISIWSVYYRDLITIYKISFLGSLRKLEKQESRNWTEYKRNSLSSVTIHKSISWG